jgi:hypothetical protein
MDLDIDNQNGGDTAAHTTSMTLVCKLSPINIFNPESDLGGSNTHSATFTFGDDGSYNSFEARVHYAGIHVSGDITVRVGVTIVECDSLPGLVDQSFNATYDVPTERFVRWEKFSFEIEVPDIEVTEVSNEANARGKYSATVVLPDSTSTVIYFTYKDQPVEGDSTQAITVDECQPYSKHWFLVLNVNLHTDGDRQFLRVAA